MPLKKKINQWQEAGLISKQTAQNIYNFEQENFAGKKQKTPFSLWAIGGIGAFSIIVGLISVVAANWLQTPKEVKLGIDLLLCATLAIALYKNHLRIGTSNKNLWLHETLVMIYYGLTLASMALIGQIYQLEGSIAQLLLVWTLITIPLVLLARSKFIAIIWGIASAITYLMNIIELHNVLKSSWGYQSQFAENTAITLLALGPLLFIHLSRIPWLVQHRLVFSNEISRLAWLTIIIAGFFSQFLWYSVANITTSVFITLAIFTLFSLFVIPKIYTSASKDSHLAMRVVLASVYLLTLSANWNNSSFAVIGALSNLLYFSILAWAALKIGSISLFNVMTAMISLRILIIYFEVFGSMLETGLGLITMGSLTLGLVWLWLKKSTKLAQQLSH